MRRLAELTFGIVVVGAFVVAVYGSLVWTIVHDWDAARSPGAFLACGAALAAALAVYGLYSWADPLSLGPIGPALETINACLIGLAIVTSELVGYFDPEPSLRVALAGYGLTAVLSLTLMLAVVALSARRHGDAASDAVRAALRRRLGLRSG